MEFRRLWINVIIKKDINVKLNSADNEYLPPFDTANLRKEIIGNESCEEAKQSNDAYATLKFDEILSVKDFDNNHHIRDTALLANSLGGVTILRKGAIDIICDGNDFILIGDPCSLRRCGGQGDVLAGIAGLWLYWSRLQMYNKESDVNNMSPPLIAGYAASYVTRHVAVEAFNKYKRSTLTTDMISCIPQVLDTLFPVSNLTSSL